MDGTCHVLHVLLRNYHRVRYSLYGSSSILYIGGILPTKKPKAMALSYRLGFSHGIPVCLSVYQGILDQNADVKSRTWENLVIKKKQ